MSKMICVMGESGSGKTTSMRNLPPQQTYYIDCDGKGLAWKGWRGQYSLERKNFWSTRNIPGIEAVLIKISNERPEIKNVVIDTLNTCMVHHEVTRMKEYGFDKWTDLTQFVWNTLTTAAKLREDLTVIVVMHSETLHEESGYSYTRVKTNGRRLEKIVPESLFGTVLLAKRTEDGRYIFETQAKNSSAKSPMGAFDAFEIDNDMQKVLEALKEY